MVCGKAEANGEPEADLGGVAELDLRTRQGAETGTALHGMAAE